MISRYLVIGLIAAAVIAAIGGYILAQANRLHAQEQTIAEQAEDIGALRLANAAQDAALTELRDAKKRDDALVADAAGKIDALTTRLRTLDRTTREALRNAPDLTLASFLPADAADALCLQWHAASGRIAPDHPGDAAGGPDARTGDTAPAGGGTVGPHGSGQPRGGAGAFSGEPGLTPGATRTAIASAPQKVGPSECSQWRKMTVRDAVEWNDLLLRHAGLERLDKAALRRWAEEGGK